ncbi:cell division protein FtsQ/DivIB [Aquicella lusitana]|uniref:Cell division protein FtsQ n=1 Tax=Aquicella lusitana TaxID=254246 RepID=A0A370GN84_9COXI|nr:cell division protein FtsQ/DivIB [Aquicella lusitana]RDI44779.1 cell division protein FtsQ [Aquicella lusitana]VVC72976.1 Cell division protein FtsQ [Aquicella lusitana]
MDIRKGKPILSPFQYLTQTLKLVVLGLVILSCLYALNSFKLSSHFPIKTVRVYGVNRIDRQEIQTLLLPLVNSGFFKVNVDYIQDRLLQLPWVANIFVRRHWPDQVEIRVIEKNPVARWNNHSLLAEGGELFSPRKETYPSRLPQFVGPDGKQVTMLKYFYSMNRLLMPLHAKIAYLEMTPYFTWKLILDNGITLQIGHKDILTRLNHFVKVYPKIVGSRAADVESIDLRYPNGVAVRWKEAMTA